MKSKWTIDEDEKLKKLCGEGLSSREISNILNKSQSNVSKRTRDMGLIRNLPATGKTFSCMGCGIEIKSRKNTNRKFCSLICQSKFRVISKYEKYLVDENYYYGYKTSMSWIKPHILREQNNCCEICTISNSWNGKSLIFILDHIDGDACNNKRSNLRLVCPNCDSQLDTYKAKNIGKSTRKYKPHLL